MGRSRERAIAVINIIMSALFVCTVAVALFDLLYGISFSFFLSLYRRKRTKFDCIQSPFSSLFNGDRYIQTCLSPSLDDGRGKKYVYKTHHKKKYIPKLIVNKFYHFDIK